MPSAVTKEPANAAKQQQYQSKARSVPRASREVPGWVGGALIELK